MRCWRERGDWRPHPRRQADWVWMQGVELWSGYWGAACSPPGVGLLPSRVAGPVEHHSGNQRGAARDELNHCRCPPRGVGKPSLPHPSRELREFARSQARRRNGADFGPAAIVVKVDRGHQGVDFLEIGCLEDDWTADGYRG